MSSYTLADILRAPASEDVGSCPHTLGPFVFHSPNALPIILEDRPLEAADGEAEKEMDTFMEEVNEVLTFDGGVPEEGEITIASINL